MTSVRQFLFVFIILHLGFSCLGQTLEPFKVEYANYPFSQITSNDTVEVRFQEFEVGAILPIVRKEKLNLLGGAVFRMVLPENTIQEFESDLIFLGIRLIGIYKLSSGNEIVLNAFPAISTADNTQTFSGENFLMQGGLFYRHHVNERLFYTLGVISTSRFGRPLVLPLLGVSYRAEKFSFSANLPILLEAKWNYMNPFSFGLKASANGSQYNVQNESESGNQFDLIRFSRVQIGGLLEYRIKGPLTVSIFGGVAASRIYEFELIDSESINLDLENAPFVSAKLSFKPNPKNDELFKM